MALLTRGHHENYSQRCFRLVNLRGSRDDLIIDPDSDPDVDVDGPVIQAIHREAAALDAEQLEALSHEMASITLAAQTSALAHLAQQLTAQPSSAYDQEETTVYYGGEQLAIKQLAGHEPFRKDFANAYNAWLLLRLQRRDKSVLQPLEELLRVGYWLYSEGSNQETSITPFAKSPSHRKVISLPQSLRERTTRARYARAPQDDTKLQKSPRHRESRTYRQSSLPPKLESPATAPLRCACMTRSLRK